MQIPTYQIGLIQAQAYRKLQLSFRIALKPYEITIPEWSLLGVIYDRGQLSLTEIAEILKSKASHPTVLVDSLVARGLLQRDGSTKDHRVKVVTITALGQELVPVIERAARASLAHDLQRTPRPELEQYFRTLQRFADDLPEE